MRELTPEEEKKYEDLTKEVIQKISNAVLKIEEAKDRLDFIVNETGWDDLLISCNLDEALVKMAFVLAGLNVWLEDENEEN